MSPGEFEAAVRRELAARDRRRAARLFQASQEAEADEMFVAAVMEAAGHGAPGDGGKALRSARRSRQRDFAEAFGD